MAVSVAGARGVDAAAPAQPPVQAPVATARAARSSACSARAADGLVWRRRSRPRGLPPTVPAKTVVSTLPCGIDERAAGVAGPHQPAQRRQQPRDRALAVGVLGDHRLGAPDAPGLRRRTARSRDSRGSRPPCRTAVFGGEASATAGRVRGRAARRCRRWDRRRSPAPSRPAGSPPDLHGRVLLAGDDVGVGDDDAGRGDPAGALDRQAAGGAEHAHDAARGALARRRRGRSRGSGAATSARGPGDRGQRVEPRERVQDRARRRQHLVQLAQDRRALDVGAQLALAGCLRGDGRERSTRSRGRAPRRAAPRARRRAGPGRG